MLGLGDCAIPDCGPDSETASQTGQAFTDPHLHRRIMTKSLLDAQYALFKAQMQYEQASPGKVEVIEELVSKVGKLLEDEKAGNGRRCYNTRTNGTEASSVRTFDPFCKKRLKTTATLV